MTDHLQTILNCAAEPITLAQSRFQLSLIKEVCGMTMQISFATYFPLRVCPSLLNLGRTSVKHAKH